MTSGTIDAPRTMKDLSREAAQAADKASAPYVAETDRGIHKDPIDRMCDELIAAGWKSLSAHGRSPVWESPDGLKFPGPGYAHSLMVKQNESAK